MCEECRTGICEIFDNLAREYFRDFPPTDETIQKFLNEFPLMASEYRRRKYMPMDVENAPKSAATETEFSKMADAADGIGMKRMEFLTELSSRSGFGDAIMAWAKGKIPNGLARKIILTNVEDVLRERGAKPEMSMQLAA